LIEQQPAVDDRVPRRPQADVILDRQPQQPQAAAMEPRAVGEDSQLLQVGDEVVRPVAPAPVFLANAEGADVRETSPFAVPVAAPPPSRRGRCFRQA
jgi:hypothetical protein